MPNADIFISYRRDQRDQVQLIAGKLQDLGLSVWFDARLEAGTSFDEEINREVRSAKAVLVCWTPEAVQSRWVRAEASIGLERDVLVAIFLKPAELVPPYNLVHAATLEGWNGDQDAPAWRELLARIGKLIGRPHLVEEAVAKSLDAEWVDRDREERAAFNRKVDEARRMFAANYEAQPALFNQALSDMTTAFESWILRRRINALGPAPDPLTLVVDEKESLRIDLATAQRERDAASTLASRMGRTASAAASTAAAPPAAAEPAEGKTPPWIKAVGKAVSTLFFGPLALIVMNKKWLAFAAVACLIPAAVLAYSIALGARYSPYSASDDAKQVCYSHELSGWFAEPGDVDSYRTQQAAAATPSAAETSDAQAAAATTERYASREAAETALRARQGLPAVDSTATTAETTTTTTAPPPPSAPGEDWQRQMTDSCEYQADIQGARSSARDEGWASGDYYGRGEGAGSLLAGVAFLVAVFNAIFGVIVLIQGLAARRRKAAKPAEAATP